MAAGGFTFPTGARKDEWFELSERRGPIDLNVNCGSGIAAIPISYLKVFMQRNFISAFYDCKLKIF